jgi:3'(2'), 5'-bisphosphate nucleotidase
MYDRELEVALAAARAAGREVLTRYQSFTALADAPADITTDADRASQETVLRTIKAAFPGDALCAEEETDALKGAPHEGPRLWIVDPIDGTRGFVKKIGEFSVMVSYVEDGETAAGVVLEPAHDRVTFARRGGGCWVQVGEGSPTRCRVGAAAELAKSTLTQSHSKPPRKPNDPVNLLQPGRVVETYSAGVKLALVARGEADLYVNTYEAFHDWDIAAGHILVTEAGGRVTTLGGDEIHYGTPGNWQRGGLLASNGAVHAAALKGLASR